MVAEALAEAGRGFEARLRAAWSRAEAGRLDEASEALRELTADFPGSDVAWHDLGLCLSAANCFEEAAAAFREALERNPEREDTLYNLGVASERLGAPAQAMEAYGAALDVNGCFLEPGLALGHLLERAGQPERAAEAWLGVAMRLSAERLWRDASRALSEAARVRPQDAGIHALRGENLLRVGDHAAAVGAFERTVALEAGFPEAWHNLGLARYHAGDLRAAMRSFRQALELRPVFPQARNALGNCHARLGDPVAAVREYRFAINQFPNYPEAHLNLAQELHALGLSAEAEGICIRALELDAGNALAHTTLSWLLLSRGEFSRGWPAFAWRTAATHDGRYLPDPRNLSERLPPPRTVPKAGLAGRRVLLIGTGGLGTELFFLRFLPRLRASGCAAVEILTQARLAPLLSRSGLFDAVHRRDEPFVGDFDLAVSVGDLPLLLGHATGDSLGEPLRLEACGTARETLQARLAGVDGPVLALTWQAGLEGDGPRRKAVDPAALARAVSDWPGPIVSVQRAAAAADLEALRTTLGRPVTDLGEINDDLELALAFFERRVEYVGVSNTNMYLAAAAGAAARVLVKQPAEWRWTGDEPGRSRWFADFALYEEDPRRGWGPALARLANDLRSSAGVAPK